MVLFICRVGLEDVGWLCGFSWDMFGCGVCVLAFYIAVWVVFVVLFNGLVFGCGVVTVWWVVVGF